MFSRECTRLWQAASMSNITASVLSEFDGVLFCKNSLILAYHSVLNLRFSQIMTKLFVSLALHLAVTESVCGLD